MRSLVNVRLAERRMSKEQLGELVGFGRTKVWQMSRDEDETAERDVTDFKLRDLRKVAEALGCKVSDLFEE